MKDEIKDGGPAFPVHRDYEAFNPGMSLRDYFAAKFAAAMMTATSANRGYPNVDYRPDARSTTIAERVSTIAYRMTDAMLKARKS